MSKTTAAFERAYNQLNPRQKQAVDTIDGPVMVVAGPGTGKTQVLTLRIANIIKQTDTEPENILALTFTEAGVRAMRKRLLGLIGNAAHAVTITTFHGFANDIIQRHPEHFPEIIGAQAITQVEQVALIEGVVIDTELDLLKPFGDTLYYVRSILAGINQLKREGVNPEQFAESIAAEQTDFDAIEDLYHNKGAHKGKMKSQYQRLQKKIFKNRELATIYAAYQDLLRENRHYDFADMIMQVVMQFQSNENLLLEIQEQYHYILVDEHQDTNNAQNALVERLASFHDNPNVFVVGDDKQSIFRFQGASLENFFYFKHLYPGAELIALDQNYRSTQAILDSAFSLMETGAELVANVDYEKKPVHVYALPDSQTELYFVASDIANRIADGADVSEIAILYRNNRDAFPIARMLEKFAVPFMIESDQDMLSSPDIRQLITILRALNNYGDDQYLAEVLHLDLFDLDPLDVYRLIRAASQKRKYSLYDVLSRKDLRKDLVLENTDTVEEFYANLLTWAKSVRKVDLVTLVEQIMRQSGLFQQAMAGDDRADRLDALHDFFDLVRSLDNNQSATLNDLFVYLDTVQKHKVLVKKRGRRGSIPKVRLMTAHGAKGLEFDYVYVINAYAGHFGNTRRRELLPILPRVFQLIQDPDKSDVLGEPDTNTDDRRLFYVALTRAKRHAIISYAESGADGKEQLPSQFITEINPELLQFMDVTDIVAAAESDQGRFFVNTESQPASREALQSFVRDAFLAQGFSPTSLNNYLQSPWTYFYRNLVRLPSAPSKHQGYGIAVHAAVHDLFENIRHGESVQSEYLIQRFDQHLDRQTYMDDKDAKEARKRAHEQLPAWYQQYHERWVTQTVNEFRINGVTLMIDDDTPLRLTGVIDKMEFLSEREVNVVDYKTGKPKSRNHILGNTKTSNGDYHRQLVFYKLLLNLWKDGYYEMQSGEIDFIAADTKGVFHKEQFAITDEEVADLTETIRRVAKEIINLEFIDQPCDPDVCDYCDLVEGVKL